MSTYLKSFSKVLDGTPDIAKLTWLAALIDGEGCVRLQFSKYGTVFPRVNISNNSLPLLNTVKLYFGGRVVPSTTSVYNITWSTNRDVLSILGKVKDFLIVKSKVAPIVYQFAKHRVENEGISYVKRDAEIVRQYLTCRGKTFKHTDKFFEKVGNQKEPKRYKKGYLRSVVTSLTSQFTERELRDSLQLKRSLHGRLRNLERQGYLASERIGPRVYWRSC